MSAHVERLRHRLAQRASDLQQFTLVQPSISAEEAKARSERVLLSGWMMIRTRAGAFTTGSVAQSDHASSSASADKIGHWILDKVGAAARGMHGGHRIPAGSWRRQFVRIRPGRITCHETATRVEHDDSDASAFSKTLLQQGEKALPALRDDGQTLLVQGEHGTLELRPCPPQQGGSSAKKGDVSSNRTLEPWLTAATEAQRGGALRPESRHESRARALCEMCPAVAEDSLVEYLFVQPFGVCFRGGERHAALIAARATQQAVLGGEKEGALSALLSLPDDSAWAYSTVQAIGRLRNQLLSLIDAGVLTAQVAPSLKEQRRVGTRQIERIAEACALVVVVRADPKADERDAALPPPHRLGELVSHVLYGLKRRFKHELRKSLPRMLMQETWTPIDEFAQITGSVVDLVQQLNQLIDMFNVVATLDGLPARASLSAVPPFIKLLNEQVSDYCGLLKLQWSRGETSLPGAAGGHAVWCVAAERGRAESLQTAARAASAALSTTTAASANQSEKRRRVASSPASRQGASRSSRLPKRRRAGARPPRHPHLQTQPPSPARAASRCKRSLALLWRAARRRR